MKYSLVTNNYDKTNSIKNELIELLNKNNFVEDEKNPDIVFVIGGDGTFLVAIHKYQHLLDKLVFAPIKFGGIGFYTNKNRIEDLQEAICCDLLKNANITQLGLLEVNFNDKKVYAINEIKVTNHTRPLTTKIYINDELLEEFKGTGLVFATPSGSTGFMKSANGAIIYPEVSLYEMQELMPVSTNKFRTLNAPVIFSDQQQIKLELDSLDKVGLSADTFEYDLESKNLLVKLSSKKINLLNLSKHKISKTEILNDIFVLNDKTKS
ncbi:NAD(+)/NADH kinase [Mycoplasma sp. HU2014]|uniref:NAD(+)/NADH kinase n=1 Tax=Mycoplasma sp. HU2014 TaxID=1664275 RepID=UPI00067E4B1E|nr:NAD(+)/NADH kinase [Mycoplasma sp. HU2014]KNG79122.1 putative inorganic polyphosphate/ATP-NAD kinase [Mycoplasma sp. HU2014]